MSLSKNLASNLASIETKLTKCWGMREASEELKTKTKKILKRCINKKAKIIQAVYVIQGVAISTQEQFEHEVSDLVTAAIRAIFKEELSLKIRFEMKRNKTEAEIFVTDNKGHLIDLFNDDGGGLIDIVSIALRFTCARLSSDGNDKVFLFDEPWKNLSAAYRPAAMEFMKEICDKMGMQIAMVTHITEFIENADRVIEIK